MTKLSSLLDDLRWRGLVAEVSDEEGLTELLESGPTAVYAGYDPTAESLHIGNLQVVCLLARFNNEGHTPIALAGGGTGLIGDPSGRSTERQLQSREVVESWTAEIESQLRNVLGRVTGADTPDPTFVNNRGWIEPMRAVEFLRDVGKHFSLNAMIAKESVAARLAAGERGLSFTEFSYMLLQALDFGELYDRYGCRIQVGGSDQWGNISIGLDYLRRTGRTGAYGLTSPLILRSDGEKFGKSVDGAVWLSSRMTSPFALYQYFLNIADTDVVPMLKRLTFLDRPEIEELEEATRATPQERAAQRRLASEITTIVHGPDALDEAVEISEWIFGGAERPEVLRTNAEAKLAGFAIRILSPTDDLTWADVVAEAGLAKSLSEGRRLISSGGIYVSGRRLEGDGVVDAGTLPSDGLVLVRRGKKTPAVVQFR